MKQQFSSKKPRIVPLPYTFRASIKMMDKMGVGRVRMTFDKEFKRCYPSNDFHLDKWYRKHLKLLNKLHKIQKVL